MSNQKPKIADEVTNKVALKSNWFRWPPGTPKITKNAVLRLFCKDTIRKFATLCVSTTKSTNDEYNAIFAIGTQNLCHVTSITTTHCVLFEAIRRITKPAAITVFHSFLSFGSVCNMISSVPFQTSWFWWSWVFNFHGPWTTRRIDDSSLRMCTTPKYQCVCGLVVAVASIRIRCANLWPQLIK